MGAVVVWQDGAVVVTSVNPLGPAGVSGEVLVGDRIVAVGSIEVSSVEQARGLIMGPGKLPPLFCSSLKHRSSRISL
jgi:C-terminal processing protease CtpA/Prc